MVKAFLFDNGGVMTRGGRGNEFSQRLGKILGLDPDKTFKLFRPLWVDYSCGKLSEEELWDAVELECGRPILMSQRNVWNRWEDMRPVPEMVAFVSRLRDIGYPVGLLSNVIPNTEHAIRTHGGYDGFDFLVLSCKVGVCKPDPFIYTLAMRHLDGIKPEEVVFLDDQAPNLVSAKKMGMKTILVHDPLQAIEAALEHMVR